MSEPAQFPGLLVFSSLFPNENAPTAGLFIKERMFRYARHSKIAVIAPQAWSPFDGLLRLKWPNYRKPARGHEVQEGIEIFRPKVLSIPVIFKAWDGWLMARGSRRTAKKIIANFKPQVIDAHFCYPDGYAASILAQEFDLPLTITLRGSKDERLLRTPREKQVFEALRRCAHVISVSQALKESVAMKAGLEPEAVTVIGNGVDLAKFDQMPKEQARIRIGLPLHSKVLVSVGNLIALKGHLRLIELMPTLLKSSPDLLLLIVGGEVSGDPTAAAMQRRITELGLSGNVKLMGRVEPAELKWHYSAADLFVSATEFEGWANVLLEAMACGLPVVTTRVGGNPEVVNAPNLGTLVTYWDPVEAAQAILAALQHDWDIAAIKRYAFESQWDSRVEALQKVFSAICRPTGKQ